MTWIPIGPDFVTQRFNAREQNTRRLSRWNEAGRNGWIAPIEIYRRNANYLYVCERPSSGGRTAFRSRDGGHSWTPISDALQRADPDVDPSCIAIHPNDPDTIYLGTRGDRGLYVSVNGGDDWGPKLPLLAPASRIVLDPAFVSTERGVSAASVIYTSGTSGVHVSVDGGQNWTTSLRTNCDDLLALFDEAGGKRFFACGRQSGLWYSTDPVDPTSWTNLSAAGIGLPAYVPASPAVAATPTTPATPAVLESFLAMRVASCPLNPRRVYLWVVRKDPNVSNRPMTEGIYTTTDTATAWSRTWRPEPTATRPPSALKDWLYCFQFAVAPNSPGDGVNDVLFIGNSRLHRSIDSGRSWSQVGRNVAAGEDDGFNFHLDIQAFAFDPDDGSALPALYVGCDGGLWRASRLCNPTLNFAIRPVRFGGGADEDEQDNGWYENLNHGRQDVALYAHASHSDLSALNYIGCQDTGMARGAKSLTWRSFQDGDSGSHVVAPGSDGVKVWANDNARLRLYTDQGERFTVTEITLAGDTSGQPLRGTSDPVLTLSNEALSGVTYWRDHGLVTTAIVPDPNNSTNPRTVQPGDMRGIIVGTVLEIGVASLEQTPLPKGRERVQVLATTTTTFTAVFRQRHGAGARVVRHVHRVVRISDQGLATPIGAPFTTEVMVLAVHSSDADTYVCATRDNRWDIGWGDRRRKTERVWRLTNATTADGSSPWPELAPNTVIAGTSAAPADTDITALVVDDRERVFALLRDPVVDTGAGGAATPLFRVGATWNGQPCTDLPPVTRSGEFVAMRQHPSLPDLFVAHGNKVYRVLPGSELDGAVLDWRWIDISDDSLPGTWIYSLWVGSVPGETAGSRQAVVRVGATSRGVWESYPDRPVDFDRRPSIFMRNNILDEGIGPYREGVPDPFDPTHGLRHYKSPDIMLEGVQRADGDEGAEFFQTGGSPELRSIDIGHNDFENIIAERSPIVAQRSARLHVQVHNRSPAAAGNVYVWAIYAAAAAGLPALWSSFASQFWSNGQIVPDIPADSPWTAFGGPRPLRSVTPDQPQVVSWRWDVPDSLFVRSLGHHCAVVLLHSRSNPLSPTSLSVDELSRNLQQVAQRNFHIVPTWRSE